MNKLCYLYTREVYARAYVCMWQLCCIVLVHHHHSLPLTQSLIVLYFNDKLRTLSTRTYAYLMNAHRLVSTSNCLCRTMNIYVHNQCTYIYSYVSHIILNCYSISSTVEKKKTMNRGSPKMAAIAVSRRRQRHTQSTRGIH